MAFITVDSVVAKEIKLFSSYWPACISNICADVTLPVQVYCYVVLKRRQA